MLQCLNGELGRIKAQKDPLTWRTKETFLSDILDKAAPKPDSSTVGKQQLLQWQVDSPDSSNSVEKWSVVVSVEWKTGTTVVPVEEKVFSFFRW